MDPIFIFKLKVKHENSRHLIFLLQDVWDVSWMVLNECWPILILGCCCALDMGRRIQKYGDWPN